jgi:hypothetical protein
MHSIQPQNLSNAEFLRYITLMDPHNLPANWACDLLRRFVALHDKVNDDIL